jgi:hypothetical protein
MPLVREHLFADRHLIDGHNPGIGRDRRPRRKTDAARDAGLLANRGFRGLRIDPDDLGAGALGRAKRNALEVTALRLTTILEYDRDAHGNSMIRELFKRAMVGPVSAEPLSDSGPSIPM